MQVGTRVGGDELRQFIRVAEYVMGLIRTRRRPGVEEDAADVTKLIFAGVNNHMPEWDQVKIAVSWKVMLQLRMRRVPPSYVDYFIVLRNNSIEMHLKEGK